MKAKEAKRIKDFYFKWLDTPDEGRLIKTQKEFAIGKGVSEQTLVGWKKEHVKVVADENFDPMEWLKGQTPAVVKALIRSVEKGNAQSQKICFQLLGLLTEKSEVDIKIGLSADEHRRVREEGQRRLQEALDGGAGGTGGLLSRVQGVHIFSEEVCMDNQQEHSSDSEVGAVELSS